MEYQLFTSNKPLSLSRNQAFSRNRRGTGEGRAELFALKQLVCDEVHFKNHANKAETDEEDSKWKKFCRLECDPKRHESSSDANTEVCEQVQT